MAATTTSKPQLNICQQSTVDRAREVLAQEHDSGLYGLAVRIGQLEYHLGELLALTDRITKDAQ